MNSTFSTTVILIKQNILMTGSAHSECFVWFQPKKHYRKGALKSSHSISK
jgi:hypothetical protein